MSMSLPKKTPRMMIERRLARSFPFMKTTTAVYPNIITENTKSTQKRISKTIFRGNCLVLKKLAQYPNIMT